MDKIEAKVITPVDSFTHLGLSHVPRMFSAISATPDEDIANRHGTEFVVAYPGISLCELAKKVEYMYGAGDRWGFLYTCREAWYMNHPIGREVWTPGWYTIPGPNTDLPMPPVATVAYGLIVHALKTGQKLFTDNLVPCFGMDMYGKSPCVQYLDQGLYVTWDPTIMIG